MVKKSLRICFVTEPSCSPGRAIAPELDFSLLVLTPQYWRVTDRQTDILRQHSARYAYASRGKNTESCKRSLKRCYLELLLFDESSHHLSVHLV